MSEEHRAAIDSLINDSARDMLNHWNNTNREFQQRISESQETLGRLTTHIHLVDKEILEMDGMVDQLRTSAANRLIGEVVQSRRRPLLGPSPG